MSTPSSGSYTVFSQGLPSGGYPFGFVTGSDGNLWFTENLNNSVAIGRLSL